MHETPIPASKMKKWEDRMTREERRQKLESFGRGPALLFAALRHFPQKMWLYKPFPHSWSIHEIILHLADSEANSYVRCRRYIAEPGCPEIKVDTDRWASSLGYSHQSTREALEIIRRLRKMTYNLLVAIPDRIWVHTVSDPRDGHVNLEQWMDLQERHIRRHLEQMDQTFEAWGRTHPPRKPASRLATPTESPRLASLSTQTC
jgi:hypothetical protein